MSIEVRSLTGPESIDASDDGVIFGLAIPYNKITNIGDPKSGGFREQIAPGAAKKSLAESDIVALWNHRSDQPLGRTSAGNLTLKNSTRGVEPELTPVDTSYGRDLRELVRTGVVKGWSFGFEVVKDEWTTDDGERSDQWNGTNRTIREMRLIEVSPVTFPAYDTTEIASRSAILDAREERAKAAAKVEAEEQPETGEERGGDAPYGDVKYADTGMQADGKKRYPIDTKRHVKAALAYIAKKKNAAAYTADQLSKVKAAIRAAAKKFGIDVSEQNESELAMEWRCYLKGYNPLEVIDAEDREAELFEDRKLKHGVAKRIAQTDTLIHEAIAALTECDLDKLPPGAQRAAAMISSAGEHIGHIMHAEKLDTTDAVGEEGHRDNEDTSAPEEREEPKPDETTSATLPDDDALRLAFGQAVSRQIELGL